MPINITMPALSPTMEEGNLAKWLVKEGDKVAPGDVIAEIETDKATMEVEAVDEGTVAKIVVPEGTEGVKVNALIAVLAAEGEDASAAKGGNSETGADRDAEAGASQGRGCETRTSQGREASGDSCGQWTCGRRAHVRLPSRPPYRKRCRH
jgi:pyruvate dehydrogenase E2 component (dihydrolipoamide acetyltransferase)